MSLSVVTPDNVTDGAYIAGFVSGEGGRGRLFVAKSSAYNYPTAKGVPAQVVAPLPEDVVDGGPSPSGNGPFTLAVTFDPASPDSGSNGRFVLTANSYVIVASTGTG